MSDPMTPAEWRTALKAEGVRFTEYDGWTTRGRDAATGKVFGPVHGVLNHHTAGSNSLRAVAVDGAPSLPAPLCHTFLPKSGIAVLVSCRRANHAGLAAKNVVAALTAEKPLPKQNAASTVDGNDCLYGIETENLGDGTDTYTREQYDAWVRWNAAICRHHGWGAGSVAGHLETSVEGKVDPRGPVEGYGKRGRFTFSMTQLRADVAERLAHPASWNPDDASQEDNDMPTAADVWKWDGVAAAPPPYNNADWNTGNKEWTAAYALSTAVLTGRKNEQKIDTLTDLVKQLATKVDDLTTQLAK
ncbi:N-acetylmuramoyl-L-alanine amidase [Streptomyces sp. NPDC002547]